MKHGCLQRILRNYIRKLFHLKCIKFLLPKYYVKRSIICTSLASLLLGIVLSSINCQLAFNDEFKLRMVSNGSDTLDTVEPLQPIKRMRYAADELGIREKLIIGLSFINHLDNINELIKWQEYKLNKIEHVTGFYFVNMAFTNLTSNSTELSNLRHLVMYNDSRMHLNAFYTIKYISETMPDAYDWIFLGYPFSYIDYDKLLFTMNNISVSQEKCFISRQGEEIIGLVLSTRSIASILKHLRDCQFHVNDINDPLTFLQRCIEFIKIMSCTEYFSNVS
ncbi:hypothetical protein GJ496_011238 [Pomphorhynchus laevis]|nr:hypothetical protein GJ496_011238 [Pomphorhynchus laevis]